MATESMNVRLKLRNDTYANLQASTLGLLKGEIAIVVDSDNINHLRYKIGIDGTKKFSELPWGDGIITYDSNGNPIVPYGNSVLGSRIAGLKSGDGIILEAEKDSSGNKTGFVKIKSSIGNLAVTSLNSLTGAVNITNNGSGISIGKNGNTITIGNTGVTSVTTATSGYGKIKVNSTDVQVSNYGIFDGSVRVRDTSVTRDIVIAAPTLSSGTDINLILPNKEGTIALISDITDKINGITLPSVKAGTGISVTQSGTDNRTYTVASTVTLQQGNSNGTLKLSTGSDVTVKGYGTFDDSININQTTVNKQAQIKTSWTSEDTQTGATFYLPKDGGTLATQSWTTTYVSTEIGKIHSFEYVVSTNAATTPKSIEWYSGTTKITGTLVASSSTEYKIYLVPCVHTSGGTQKGYDEYITVKSGSTYSWELIGNTQDIDLSTYVNTLNGTANSGVVTNLTKNGKTLTVTSTSLSTSDPSSSGDSSNFTFISNISQAANGKITPTKKAINSNRLVISEFGSALIDFKNNVSGKGSNKYAIYVSEGTTAGTVISGAVNLEDYALKNYVDGKIPTVTNYYWANVKIGSSSSTTTKPTFGSITIGNTAHTINASAATSAVALTLPQDSGTLISSGTTLILDGGNASGWS